MVWTRFMDMHSGGRQKLDWAYIYVEADNDNAAKVFMHRFGRNPNNISCSCCGEDYSFWTEYETLEEATTYDRDDGDKLVIYAQDINPGELVGETPRRGHLVWVED